MSNEHTTASGNDKPHDRSVQVPNRQPGNQAGQQHAAELIRAQLNTIYDQTPPHQLPKAMAEDTNNRTYASGAEYDWQHYHSSWQHYYQQYYQRYYAAQQHALRQQQLVEKAGAASQATAQAGILTGSNTAATPKTQFAAIKGELLRIVADRAKKARHSHHFVPLVSALTVGLIFLFLEYNRVLVAEVQAYVTPSTQAAQSETVLVDPTANLNVGPEPRLIIPKINVNTKVVYDITSLEDGPVQEGLKQGVVHYKLPGANSLPGQLGNTVLLGHSSNDIFDPGESKFVFVLLDHLQPGDVFYLHYQGKRYIYRVNEKKIIKPTEVNTLQIANGKPLATLVTCTPLGTALKRLLIIAEQISPDPTAATQTSSGNASSSEPALLPGNSPTFIEKIKDFFF